MSAVPAGEAPIRASLLRCIRERVNDLPGLIDALDLETDPGAAAVEAERLADENERLKAWLCLCTDGMPADFNPDEQCPVHGDPKQPRPGLRDALKWRAAFESLHARVAAARDIDGFESALLHQEEWAAQIDDLVAFADQCHPEIGTETAP